MDGILPSQTQPPSQQPQQPPSQQPQQAAPPSQLPPPERLNPAVQQQLNLEALKTRAISLFKAISRILEEFNAYARTNTTPKWQDILGQYSMVNLELFNIKEEIKKVSKAFVVHPKNVNAENASILPVMLSSKLLPEMETDDNTKREQLLEGMQNLPVPAQIEKIKARIDTISAACESAEKVLSDTRKAYGFGTRQGPAIMPTLDKSQAAKVQEQENLLRATVNFGEGLHANGDQRQFTSVLPMHLADVLPMGDGGQTHSDSSGMYQKSTPLSNSMAGQGNMLQGSGSQLLARSAASPSAASYENTTTSPLQYANSPRSGTNIMNTPSPQQQAHQQQQQQQQQRQKMMLPQHQQQILAQQQFRQSAIQGIGQLHGQHQMQFSQPLGHQQFQARQLPTGHVQHGLGQSQLNQGNSMNRLGQFSGAANTSLFSAGQTTPNTQMIPNISATMPSQSLLPRMQQFGLSGTNPQRSNASQILNDQMFNMGAANPGGMMPIQQQQHVSQGQYGNLSSNAQSLQSGMVGLQNQNAQNHPNFAQQRQQNQ